MSAAKAVKAARAAGIHFEIVGDDLQLEAFATRLFSDIHITFQARAYEPPSSESVDQKHHLFPNGNTVFQSAFISTMVQPFASPSSRALSRWPITDIAVISPFANCVGVVHDQCEARTRSGRSPLQHLKVSIRIAECRNRAEPNVLLDTDRLVCLVVVEIEPRQPHEYRYSIVYLEFSLDTTTDHLLGRDAIDLLSPGPHEIDAATRDDEGLEVAGPADRPLIPASVGRPSRCKDVSSQGVWRLQSSLLRSG